MTHSLEAATLTVRCFERTSLRYTHFVPSKCTKFCVDKRQIGRTPYLHEPRREEAVRPHCFGGTFSCPHSFGCPPNVTHIPTFVHTNDYYESIYIYIYIYVVSRVSVSCIVFISFCRGPCQLSLRAYT